MKTNIDYKVPVTCNLCGSVKELGVNKGDYEKWVRKEGCIQDLLHYLSAGDRELLISSTCDDCFTKMFPDTEE
jgi:hypothetical protein